MSYIAFDFDTEMKAAIERKFRQRKDVHFKITYKVMDKVFKPLDSQ